MLRPSSDSQVPRPSRGIKWPEFSLMELFRFISVNILLTPSPIEFKNCLKQKQSLSTPSNMDHQTFYQIFNCWLYIIIYFFCKIFSLDSNQNRTKDDNIADCLTESIWKLIKQNKLFDGIIDIIYDDPYLTE